MIASLLFAVIVNAAAWTVHRKGDKCIHIQLAGTGASVLGQNEGRRVKKGSTAFPNNVEDVRLGLASVKFALWQRAELTNASSVNRVPRHRAIPRG